MAGDKVCEDDLVLLQDIGGGRLLHERVRQAKALLSRGLVKRRPYGWTFFELTEKGRQVVERHEE